MIDKQMKMLGDMDSYSHGGSGGDTGKEIGKGFDKFTISFDKFGKSIESLTSDMGRAFSSIESYFEDQSSKSSGDLRVLMGIESGIMDMKDVLWQSAWPRSRIGRLKRRTQQKDLEQIVDVLSDNVKFTKKLDSSMKDSFKEETDKLLDSMGKKATPDKIAGGDVKAGIHKDVAKDVGSMDRGIDRRKEKREEDIFDEETERLEDIMDKSIKSLADNSDSNNDNLLVSLNDIQRSSRQTVEIGNKSLIKAGVLGALYVKAIDSFKEEVPRLMKGELEGAEQHFSRVADNLMLTIGKTYGEALEMQRGLLDIPRQLSYELEKGFMGIRRTVITVDQLDSAMEKAVETGAVDPEFLTKLTEVYAKSAVLMPRVDLSQMDFVTRSVDLLSDGVEHMTHIMTVAKDLSMSYYVDTQSLLKAVDEYYYTIATMTNSSHEFMQVQRNLMATTAALEDSFLNASEIIKKAHDMAWKPLSQISQNEWIQYSAMGIDVMEMRKLQRTGDYATVAQMMVDGYRKVGMDTGLFDQGGKFVEGPGTEAAIEYMVGTLGMDIDKLRVMMQEGGAFSGALEDAFKDTEIMLDPDRAQERYLEMLNNNVKKDLVQDVKGILNRTVQSSKLFTRVADGIENLGLNFGNIAMGALALNAFLPGESLADTFKIWFGRASEGAVTGTASGFVGEAVTAGVAEGAASEGFKYFTASGDEMIKNEVSGISRSLGGISSTLRTHAPDLTASFQSMTSGLKKQLASVSTMFLASLNSAWKWFMVKFTATLAWMNKTFATSGLLTNVKKRVGGLATSAGGVASGLGKKALASKAGMAVSAIPGKVGAAAGIGKVGALAGGLMAIPGIGWIIAGLVAIGTAIYAIVKNWDKIKEYFAKVTEPMKRAIEGFKESLMNLWNSIKEAGKALWNAVKPVFQVIGFVVKVIGAVVLAPLFLMFKAIQGIVFLLTGVIKVLTWVVNIIATPFKMIVGYFQGFWKSISEAFGGVKDAFGNVIQAFKDAWASIKGVFAPILDLFKSDKEGPGFLVKVLTGLGKLVGWIISVPFRLLAKGLENLAKFIGFVVNLIKKPIEFFVGIVMSVVDKVRGIITAIVEWVKGLPIIGKLFSDGEKKKSGKTVEASTYGVGDYSRHDRGMDVYSDGGISSGRKIVVDPDALIASAESRYGEGRWSSSDSMAGISRGFALSSNDLLGSVEKNLAEQLDSDKPLIEPDDMHIKSVGNIYIGSVDGIGSGGSLMSSDLPLPLIGKVLKGMLEKREERQESLREFVSDVGSKLLDPSFIGRAFADRFGEGSGLVGRVASLVGGDDRGRAVMSAEQGRAGGDDVIDILGETYEMLQTKLNRIIALMPEGEKRKSVPVERDVPTDQTHITHQLDLTKDYANNYAKI